MKTRTLFRKMKDGEIVAIMPEIPATHTGLLCTCYAHVGQHSACCPDYARCGKPATPDEYASLKAELEAIGYEIEVIQRTPRNAFRKRILALSVMAH